MQLGLVLGSEPRTAVGTVLPEKAGRVPESHTAAVLICSDWLSRWLHNCCRSLCHTLPPLSAQMSLLQRCPRATAPAHWAAQLREPVI